MHAVIVGGGNVGEAVARWLIANGHEVTVVDEDLTVCDALDESLGSICVNGNGTDAAVLTRAGTNRADVLIATTRQDDVNLVCCQLAKQHFGVARSIAVASSQDHADLFGLLGIDAPIDVVEFLVGRIQAGLTAHGLVQLMGLPDNKSLVYVHTPLGPGIEGRSVADLDLPEGTLLSLVVGRNGNIYVPGPGAVIHPGDHVVAVTPVHNERELRDIMMEGAED